MLDVDFSGGGFGDGEDGVTDFFSPDGGEAGNVFAGFFGEGGPEIFGFGIAVGVFFDVPADAGHEDIFSQVFRNHSDYLQSTNWIFVRIYARALGVGDGVETTVNK